MGSKRSLGYAQLYHSQEYACGQVLNLMIKLFLLQKKYSEVIILASWLNKSLSSQKNVLFC